MARHLEVLLDEPAAQEMYSLQYPPQPRMYYIISHVRKPRHTE